MLEHNRNEQVSERERERDGHFLSRYMLTFKNSYFVKHPPVQRPNHSSTYPCTFQNPGGWVGPSFMAISLHTCLLSLLTFSSWYVSNNIKPLSIKLLRYKTLYPYIIYCKSYLVYALSNSKRHSKTFAKYFGRYNC